MLTMNNDYSFQRAIGYQGDPEAMSTDDVKAELARWSEVVRSLLEGEKQNPDLLDGLDGFLAELSKGEVKYEHPLTTYCYHVGFEYYDNFEVVAESQEQADEQALKVFNAMAEGMPKRINEAKGCFKYLEQYVPGYGCDKRIYED